MVSRSVRDTLKIGKAIARNSRAGDIVCLFGQLGSGKTVLVKGIAQGLGIKRDKVVSPSFVLIREHRRAKLPLYHFDLYRLKSTSAIGGLGYEEYFYDQGVTVIEWADRLKHLLPKEFLKIKISFRAPQERLLEFSARGRRYKELLGKILEDFRH